MRKDTYIAGLRRELAGRGKRNPAAADEIMRELARAGAPVENRSAAPKRAAKPKAEKPEGTEKGE